MRPACWIIKAKTHTQNKDRHVYCFITAKTVTRTCLNVTFISTLPVLLRKREEDLSYRLVSNHISEFHMTEH